MSGVAASFDQATGILKLLCETKWKKDEMQRRFFAIWGLLRDIGLAVGDGKLTEEQVRVMHPLFYKKSVLPTEITVGGRVYEILGFLKGDEKSVVGHVMVERAKEMKAHLGKEDCEFLLAHQSEIPAILRGKVVFVFPDYRDPGGHGCVAFVGWDGGGWCQNWSWLAHDWSGNDRLLRRK